MSALGSAKLPVGILHRSATHDGMEDQSWCNTDGTTFDTRIGPNYSTHRKKDASKQCLYECVAIDLFTTETKIRCARREAKRGGSARCMEGTGNSGAL